MFVFFIKIRSNNYYHVIKFLRFFRGKFSELNLIYIYFLSLKSGGISY